MAETEEKTIGAPQAQAQAEAEAEPIEEPLVEVQLPELPYTKEVFAAMKGFFKGRAKNPEFYTYTSRGDLEIKEGAESRGKKKVSAGTILLQNFVPLDPAERALLEETRQQELAALDEEYEAEMLVLKAAWDEYESTQSMRAVLNSNQQLTEIDARRNAARSQVRDCVSLPNPPIRDILVSERYEERKMFSPDDPFEKSVVRLFFHPFPAEVEMGKYVPDESVKEELKDADDEANAIAPNEILYRQRLKDGRFARIFYDTKSDVNGFMSPMFPVDFTIQVGGADSRYSSPIQAYQVERAKELGDTVLTESLMKTRSPFTVFVMVRKLKGHPKDAVGLWVKI
jgi:hypothetical protein